MKRILILFCLLYTQLSSYAQYDKNYATYYKEIIDNELYSVVEMTRKDQRIKVKYFAHKDQSGRSVYSRYMEWSRNRSIVCASVGTYFNDDQNNPKPVGICIDDGNIINRTEEKMDGLAIVYKTGGIVATNIKEGNLTVQNVGGGSVVLNLKNSLDRGKFFNWAQENSATVFQTHLLYYKGEMKISSYNSSPNSRERRMMAAAKDDEGVVHYYIVNLKASNTLYNAAEKIIRHLQSKDYIEEIIFMINLDTGYQDALEVRRPDGSVNTDKDFRGELALNVAKNLLVFYYE